MVVREETDRVLHYTAVLTLTVAAYVATLIRLCPSQKIACIKLLRQLYPDLGLLEAKIAVELIQDEYAAYSYSYVHATIQEFPHSDPLIRITTTDRTRPA
jgi:hypothetical protein